MESVETDLRQTGPSEKLAGLAHIFHLLGTDCRRNMDIILEQTWQILDGVCSLYNRIDEKRKSLTVWAGHNRPRDLETEFDAVGHICWEATAKEENRVVAIPDIEKTPFFHTDPHVKQYGLKAYLGFPVKLRDRVIGSLCIVDTKTRAFTADDLHCIRTLAAALSLEEERLALGQQIMALEVENKALRRERDQMAAELQKIQEEKGDLENQQQQMQEMVERYRRLIADLRSALVK